MKHVKAFVLMLLIGVLLFIVGCSETNNQRTSSPTPTSSPAPNPSTGKVAVPTGGKLGAKKDTATQNNNTTQKERKGVDFFVGEWGIWIPGSYAQTETDQGNDNKTLSRQYVMGQGGKILTIKADRTYHWQATTGDITGKWEETDDGRIILLQGHLDSDWYVEKTAENEIKYYSWGMVEYGTRIED